MKRKMKVNVEAMENLIKDMPAEKADRIRRAFFDLEGFDLPSNWQVAKYVAVAYPRAAWRIARHLMGRP